MTRLAGTLRPARRADRCAKLPRPRDLRGPVAGVAQTVEQRTENPCVGGSIPPPGTQAERFGDGGRQAERPRDVGSSGFCPPSPNRPTLRVGDRNSLARQCGALRRVPIGSSCFCERGGAPLSHFPPGQAGSEPEVRCHCFFRGQGTPTSGRLPLRAAQQATDRSSLSRHAGQGTPTSGRHRCAQRSEATDRSSLSRHAGQGTPTSGQFSRWGAGTAARSAARRRIAPLFHDMPGRERRPLASSPGGGRHAARSAATTDRSSPSRHAGQGTPTSGRHAARSAATTDRSSLSRHAGQGTPTSGQFSRWGPAPLRVRAATARPTDLRRACDSGSAMTDLRYRHQGGAACE